MCWSVGRSRYNPRNANRTGTSSALLLRYKKTGPFIMNAPGHVTADRAETPCLASTFFHPDFTVGVGIPAPHTAGHRLMPYCLAAVRLAGLSSWSNDVPPIGNWEFASLTLPRRLIFSCNYHS